jgi:hypothetical protein
MKTVNYQFHRSKNKKNRKLILLVFLFLDLNEIKNIFFDYKAKLLFQLLMMNPAEKFIWNSLI